MSWPPPQPDGNQTEDVSGVFGNPPSPPVLVPVLVPVLRLPRAHERRKPVSFDGSRGDRTGRPSSVQ